MKTLVNLPKFLEIESEQKWNEFCQSCHQDNLSIDHILTNQSEIRKVFGFSDFIARSCIRYPRLAIDLIQSGDLQRPYDTQEYLSRVHGAVHQATNESELMTGLRQLRCREMIRIAWRDLMGYADLDETTGDLSRFADACLEQSLAILYGWLCKSYGTPMNAAGEPQQLSIISLGKLGAWELNFSSDIDIMFMYPANGETSSISNPISNHEFFVKLCHRLITVIGTKTEDGIVFRVDTRLRPYGESGPLVMSSDAIVDYYQSQGREWERYALVKARISAGDKIEGEKLLKRLVPFVFRRFLDFGVFESLRDMKNRIEVEIKRQGIKNNIKLGAGGIREVEFFGQMFQLIRGGIDPLLRSQSIRTVLHILEKMNYISRQVCQELEAGYVFLRMVEHRLQEYSDCQTHQLPTHPNDMQRLALSMGFSDSNEFLNCLAMHRENIHSQFKRLMETKDTDVSEHSNHQIESMMESVWQKLTDDEQSLAWLKEAGFEPPEAALHILNDLRDYLSHHNLSLEGRKRIDKLVPKVLKKTATSDDPICALNRITELIKAVKKRTSYISLLLEYPEALKHLVKLVNASEWISQFLIHHPVLLDELLDTRTLYSPPKRQELEAELRQKMNHVQDNDLEIQMDELRVFKQANVLRVAAADITNAIPLMKVSDHLSDIAEVVLNEAVDLSWNYLVHKHGTPECRLNQEACERGFVVIAYGKLGGLELGYSSDLDLVFLHSGTNDQTSGKEYPIDNPQFYTRLGQRVIHILSTHTATGILYETDMRLRPSGSSGILVSHIEAFREYQLSKAWTWEKQALIKARPICGDDCLKRRFDEIRREILSVPNDPSELRDDIQRMREKMRENLSHHDPSQFDLKHDPGGIIDIEFIVQYLVLRYAHVHLQLLKWTDHVRLIRTLLDASIIDDVTAYVLRKAYLTYRSVVHRLSLKGKKQLIEKDRFEWLRHQIIHLWNTIFKW